MNAQALLSTGLANAVMAAAIALLAFAVSRKARSPAVGHFLWLLVLVKLITPPLVTLPVVVREVGSDAPAGADDGANAGFDDAVALDESVAQLPHRPIELGSGAVVIATEDRASIGSTRRAIGAGGADVDVSLRDSALIELALALELAAERGASPETAFSATQDDARVCVADPAPGIAAGDGISSGGMSRSGIESDGIAVERACGGTTPVGDGEAAMLAPASRYRAESRADGDSARDPVAAEVGSLETPGLASMLVALWAVGSATWLALVALRVLAFRRSLGRARAAPAELVRAVDDVSRRVGLARKPRVVLLDGRVSPFVWGLGARAVLVLPSALVAALSPSERDTLIAHELAHLARGDHRVRWLEILALALYWWFPIAWWSRRELRDAEDACCDARVESAFPERSPREYAAALLSAIEFLSGDAQPLPAGASGLGRVTRLRRRFEMILAGRPQRPLTIVCRLVLAAFAVGVLSWVPGLAVRAQTSSDAQTPIPEIAPGSGAPLPIAEASPVEDRAPEDGRRAARIINGLLEASPVEDTPPADGSRRRRELEDEIRELRARLDQLTRELARRSPGATRFGGALRAAAPEGVGEPGAGFAGGTTGELAPFVEPAPGGVGEPGAGFAGGTTGELAPFVEPARAIGSSAGAAIDSRPRSARSEPAPIVEPPRPVDPVATPAIGEAAPKIAEAAATIDGRRAYPIRWRGREFGLRIEVVDERGYGHREAVLLEDSASGKVCWKTVIRERLGNLLTTQVDGDSLTIVAKPGSRSAIRKATFDLASGRLVEAGADATASPNEELPADRRRHDVGRIEAGATAWPNEDLPVAVPGRPSVARAGSPAYPGIGSPPAATPSAPQRTHEPSDYGTIGESVAPALDFVQLASVVIEARGEVRLAQSRLSRVERVPEGAVSSEELEVASIERETAASKLELYERMARTALRGVERELEYLHGLRKTAAILVETGRAAPGSVASYDLRIARAEMAREILASIIDASAKKPDATSGRPTQAR